MKEFAVLSVFVVLFFVLKSYCLSQSTAVNILCPVLYILSQMGSPTIVTVDVGSPVVYEY